MLLKRSIPAMAVVVVVGTSTAVGATVAPVTLNSSDHAAVNRSIVLRFASEQFKVLGGSYQVRAVSDGRTSRPVTRPYFTFPLQSETPVSGRVVAATVSFFHPSVSLDSPDPTETMSLFSVDCFTPKQLFDLETPASKEFTTQELEELDAIFDDLGDGVAYGELTASSANNGSWQEVPLNQDAICQINDALARGAEEFSIGGSLTSINNSTSSPYPVATLERIFRGSDGLDSSPARLRLLFDDQLPPPEQCATTLRCDSGVAPIIHGPFTPLLLVSGLGMIGVFGQGRRKWI